MTILANIKTLVEEDTENSKVLIKRNTIACLMAQKATSYILTADAEIEDIHHTIFPHLKRSDVTIVFRAKYLFIGSKRFERFLEEAGLPDGWTLKHFNRRIYIELDFDWDTEEL